MKASFQRTLNKVPGHEYWDHFFEESEQDILSLLSDNCLLSEDDAKILFSRFVCIINIETSTYCNRQCAYCPNSMFDRKKQIHMSDEAWDRIVSDLEQIDYGSTISLNLYNEPLADDTLLDKVRSLRERLPGSFIKFNSNGDYLDKALLDELADAGNNAIFVTLHPGPAKEYQDSDRKKHLAILSRRLGRPLDFDVEIPGQKMRSEFQHRGMRVLVMADNWLQLGNDRSGVLSDLGIRNRTAPCMRPFREFTIAHTGYVYPCCQFFPDAESSNRHRMGRIPDMGIFEIYSSSLLSGYRRDLLGSNIKLPPCDTCRDGDNARCESMDVRNYYLEKAANTASTVT